MRNRTTTSLFGQKPQAFKVWMSQAWWDPSWESCLMDSWVLKLQMPLSEPSCMGQPENLNKTAKLTVP